MRFVPKVIAAGATALSLLIPAVASAHPHWAWRGHARSHWEAPRYHAHWAWHHPRYYRR